MFLFSAYLYAYDKALNTETDTVKIHEQVVKGIVDILHYVHGFLPVGLKGEVGCVSAEWKVVAIGIGVGVFVLLAIGGFLMALRYWLIVRRMRRQALAAARAVCPNSFVELQEHDREGLLVC